MDVFEGKSWISGQGLVHTCIGIEDGKIAEVKKILKGDKHTKFQGIILPSAFDMHVHFRDPDKHSEKYVIFRPGFTERKIVIRKLSESFGAESIDIEKLLPSGGFDLVKSKGIQLKL